MEKRKLNTAKNIALVKRGIRVEKPRCNGCPVRDCCCGCGPAHKYNDEIKPFKDAGVLEYAEKYTQYKKNKDLIKKLTRENEEIKKFLNDNGFGAVLD